MPTVVVLQSSYLPWKGYFDLIHDADLFVFYDDVQFTRQDWRSRNRIKGQAGPQWLTVPVGTDHDRLICEVTLPAGWGVKHYKTLQQCYSRTPHWAALQPWLESILVERTWATLSDFNQHVTIHIARELLGIRTGFADSRTFAPEGARMDRLFDLLTKVGATHYISGPSARSYLDEARLAAAGIELTYKDYAGYPEYPQRFPPFEHAVSIVDLLCNVGDQAPWYIWGWRQGPLG